MVAATPTTRHSVRVMRESARASVLRNEDILRLVFECLSEAADFQSLSGSATVSKAFSGPALDMIWKEVHGFFPILHLLRANYNLRKTIRDEVESRYWELEEPIPDKKWSRFLGYTRRIRVLRDVNPHRDKLHANVFAVLANRAGGTPIFPSLTVLSWDQPPHFEKEVSLFATHSLRRLELDLEWVPFEYIRTTLLIRELFSELARALPELRHLALLGCVHDAVLEVIDGFKQLRVLKVWYDGVALPSLRFCAHMEHLEELDLFIAGVADSDAAYYKDAFRRLRRLSIQSTLPAAHLALSLIWSPVLESIRLTADHADGWHDFKHDIPLTLVRFASSLRSLYIWCGFTGNESSQLLRSPMKPLLSLSLLESVTFDAHSAFLFWVEEDVLEMAQAWPRLKTLVVRMKDSTYQPSIYSLVEIARRCPDLVELEAPFDLSATPPQPIEAYPALNHGLQELRLYGCAKAAPEDIASPAQFINRLFPHARVQARMGPGPEYGEVDSRLLDLIHTLRQS